MSHKHNPPRQDRRNIGRAPVRDHAGKPSVGHSVGSKKATINDPRNGAPYGEGSGSMPGASAPGATGRSC
jgi:hypothetical protein